MSAFAPKPFTFFTLTEFLSQNFTSREKKCVWKLGPNGPEDQTPIVQIRSNAMNIISNRNLRNNVKLGARIGMDLAQSGSTVLYVNSYADPKELSATIGITEGDPRLGVLNTPIGGWDNCVLSIDSMIERHKIDTLILNSFEYAPISHFQKQKMAMQLVQLQQHYELTVIIFTTEVRKDLAAGIAGRGPIGVVSGHSETFYRLATDENGEICSGNADVHELSIKKSGSESGTRGSESGKERWPSDYETEPDLELENALAGILEGTSPKMLAELEVC